jgi:hypothetical protein
MSGLFWRILIAVVGVLLVYAVIGPLFRVIGLPLDSDVLTIVKICVAGIALFYILRGGPELPAGPR